MISNRNASLLWIGLLTVASMATTWVLACATPFTALAALAATQMRRRDGIPLMLVIWFASQAVGFRMLHYARDPKTLLWGAAIGAAAVASVFVARAASDRAGLRSGIARIGVAFLGAAIGYKAIIILSATMLGGLGIALSPVYFGQALVRDAAILVALGLLYRGLLAIGVPAAPRARLVAA